MSDALQLLASQLALMQQQAALQQQAGGGTPAGGGLAQQQALQYANAQAGMQAAAHPLAAPQPAAPTSLKPLPGFGTGLAKQPYGGRHFGPPHPGRGRVLNSWEDPLAKEPVFRSPGLNSKGQTGGGYRPAPYRFPRPSGGANSPYHFD